MSITHDELKKWLPLHTGDVIKFDVATDGQANWTTIEGKVVVDCNGVPCIHYNGQLVAIPQAGYSFTKPVVTQKADKRSSTPSAMDSSDGGLGLAKLIDDREAEAKAARSAIIQNQLNAAREQAVANVSATTQRKELNDNQQQMLRLLQGLTDRLDRIEGSVRHDRSPSARAPAPTIQGTTAANPHFAPSTSVTSTTSSLVMLPPELVTLLRTREEQDSKVFSSLISPKTDVFSQEQIAICHTNLPEYRWSKESKHHADLRAALREVAESMQKYHHISHEEHLGQITATLLSTGRVVPRYAAAEIQAMLSIANTGSGKYDWPRVSIAELAVIANMPKNLGVFIYERLRDARCTLPDSPTACIAGLCRLPLAAQSKGDAKSKDDKEKEKARAEAGERRRRTDDRKEERCRQCGAPGWKAGHVCKDADLLAFAKANPRRF